jgi:foldase protein PrsA
MSVNRLVARVVALLLVVGLFTGALAAAGCGDSVPSGAVAKVGSAVVTKGQVDELMNQVKVQTQSQSASFPAAGTATYKAYVASVVGYLVQAQLITQGAPALKVTVSNAQVTSQITSIEQSYGGEKKVLALLKKQGMTMALLKTSLRNQLLASGVATAVVKNVKVSDQQIRAYWQAHSASYQKAATRTVRHVLVPTKTNAQKVRRLLVGGATWKRVARQYSTDASSKAKGGSLGAIKRGTMGTAFDNAAFSLKKGAVSQPVHTKDGWHIIEVTASTTAVKTSFAKAKSQIKQTLLQQLQQAAWKAWLAKAAKDAPVKYAAGYDPAELTASASASASPSS